MLALDRRAVLALAVLLLLALAYAVQHFWLGRPQAVQIPAAAAPTSSTEPGPGPWAAAPSLPPSWWWTSPVASRAPASASAGWIRVADALRVAVEHCPTPTPSSSTWPAY